MIVAPIAWAKRLGGPATSFGGPSRGAITRVASSANGLSFGPVSTRAQKPRASGTSSHCAGGEQRDQGDDRHAAGDDAGGLLVDGAREGEHSAIQFRGFRLGR